MLNCEEVVKKFNEVLNDYEAIVDRLEKLFELMREVKSNKECLEVVRKVVRERIRSWKGSTSPVKQMLGLVLEATLEEVEEVSRMMEKWKKGEVEVLKWSVL